MNEQSSGTSGTLQRTALRLRVREHAALQRGVVRCGDDEKAAVEIAGLVGTLEPRHVQRAQRWLRLGRDDRHARSAVEERACLLDGDRPASDDEAAAAGQVEARDVVVLLRH